MDLKLTLFNNKRKSVEQVDKLHADLVILFDVFIFVVYAQHRAEVLFPS